MNSADHQVVRGHTDCTHAFIPTVWHFGWSLVHIVHVHVEGLSLTEWQRKELQSNLWFSHVVTCLRKLKASVLPGHRVVQDFVLGHGWTVSGTSIYTMKSNEIVTACDRKKNPSVVC